MSLRRFSFPAVGVLAAVFALGLWTGAALPGADAKTGVNPQVFHITPGAAYPVLAPGISGKILGHGPQGDVEVIDIMRAPQHIHTHIDEVVYVISGRGNATIGAKKYAIGPGDVAILPRGLAHSLFASGKTPVRLLGIAYPADDAHDMKMVK